MITKVIFKNLSSTYSYLGIGGIRFYDRNENLIESGEIISQDLLTGETDNFIITASVSAYSLAYYPINVCDTSLATQTEKYYLTKTKTNVSLEIDFKEGIESISKIEFVSYPYKNHGVNGDFVIEAYDENDVIISSYNITPSKVIGGVQTVITNELISFYITNSYQSVITTDITTVKNLNRIIKIEVVHNEPENTHIKYLVSTDDRATWKVYREGQWTEITDLSDENVIINGMNKEELESISEDFPINLNFDVKAVMITEDIEKVPVLKQIRIIH